MQKYVKGDVSISDSLKKNVSQRGLGSHRPHGTRAGLRNSSHVVHTASAYNLYKNSLRWEISYLIFVWWFWIMASVVY